MRRKAIQYNDDDPNPWFRPTLLAVRDKLRKMSSVRKDDKAKYLLIQSLLWEIRNNGSLLSTVLHEVTSLWAHHSDHIKRIYEPTVELEVITTDLGGQAIVIPEIPGYFAWTGTDPAQVPPTMGEIAQAVVTRDTSAIAPLLHEVLSDSEVKEGVRNIIFSHHWVRDRGQCACGRTYDFVEEWTKHLRVRIWRYVQDEFAPDGEEATEAASSKATT